MGGQEVGSIWGHGTYVAPDWSADWLHREAEWILDHWAESEQGRTFEQLADADQAALVFRLQPELRTDTFDRDTGDLTVSRLRADAIAAVSEHYDAIVGDNPTLAELREA